MTKINEGVNKFSWAYIAGFSIILALPILIWPPYFFPADWGKTIVFRSVLAIMLFLFLWDFFRGVIGAKQSKVSAQTHGLPRSLRSLAMTPISWAVGAVFGVYFLASIFSVDPLFSFWGSPYRGGGFVDFAFYFVFAVLAFILFKKPFDSTQGGDYWKKALDFSIIIGVLVSLVGIIQYYGLFNKFFLTVPSRPPSTMGNPDLLALYLLLLSFITLSYAIKESKIWLKLLYTFSLVIFLFTLLITGSRAGFLGLLVGAVYFFLAYPRLVGGQAKKMVGLKIGIGVLLIIACGLIFYANTTQQLPNFLKQNRLFESLQSRLSIQAVLQEVRFYVWSGVDIKLIANKPVLGYGPENFAVGFDKFYNPKIPYLGPQFDDNWWDRAHNIILQTGSDAGFLGIIAYLGLFVVLFWQLQKTKQKTENENTKIVINGIQATLIGYLAANFFGFDSFSTYLIFFLLVGYSLHLTCLDNTNQPAVIARNEVTKQSQTTGLPRRLLAPRNDKYKTPIIIVLFLILVIFLWQYNFIPLKINAEINKASNLAEQKQCDQAFAIMDKILPEHSFLDSYARIEYVEITKTCQNFYPENNLTYIKRDLELVKEAAKIQPLYTRYWIFLGNFENALASQEKDSSAKDNFLDQANNYFNKALGLSPKHQEIFIGLAQTEITAGGYNNAKNYSEKCVALNPNLGDCYFYLGLAEIYLKNKDGSTKNIETAYNKGYDINLQDNLNQLANAYASIPDYQKLASIYEKLITLNPNIPQYHSSLAFFYAKLGRYTEARQEALKVLQLSPESKQNVDAFLKTLP